MGELKYRGYLNTTLPLEQIKQLRELSKQTRIPISKLVEEALQDLLKKHHTNQTIKKDEVNNGKSPSYYIYPS